jgi:signal transduction histidine kinase
MSLRLRLIALLVVLASLLALGQWALARKLAADLERELGTAAESVGRDVLRLLERLPDSPPGVSATGEALLHQRVVVMRGEHLEVREIEESAAVTRASATDVVGGDESTASEKQGAPAGSTGDVHRGARAATPGPHPAMVGHFQVHLERVETSSGKPQVVVLRGELPAHRLAVPTSGVEEAMARFTRRLLFGSLGLFAAALALGVAVTHRFTRPLQDLADAARRVGAGGLGTAAPAAPGEVGEAIAAFNQMSTQLAALDAEARRLRASEQLSELGEVGRGLAHSLRNPLNAIGLALEELATHATGAAPAASREAHEADAVAGASPASGPASDPAAIATAARRQIRRIDAALRGFLALAAGEAPAAAVDLVAVARDVALAALQARPGNGAPPAVEVGAEAEPLPIGGVEAELRAALQALVVNAVEASPPGAPVTVSLGRDGDAVTVTVADRGAGVPVEVRARLFTPHVTTKPAGAGVGLYLAQRLASNRYGGALSVEDRAGGGTVAVLRLRDRLEPAASLASDAPPEDVRGR